MRRPRQGEVQIDCAVVEVDVHNHRVFSISVVATNKQCVTLTEVCVRLLTSSIGPGTLGPMYGLGSYPKRKFNRIADDWVLINRNDLLVQ